MQLRDNAISRPSCLASSFFFSSRLASHFKETTRLSKMKRHVERARLSGQLPVAIENEDSTGCWVSQDRAPVAQTITRGTGIFVSRRNGPHLFGLNYSSSQDDMSVFELVARQKTKKSVWRVVGICEKFLGQKSRTPYRRTSQYKSFLEEIWFSSEKTVETWPYKTVPHRLSYDLFLGKATAIQRWTNDSLISLQSVRDLTWSTSVPAVKRWLARIASWMDVLPGRSFPSFSLCLVELQRHNCIHVSSIAPHPMTFYSTVLYCTIILTFLSSIFYHMYTLPL